MREKSEKSPKADKPDESRRDFLKGSAAAAGAGLAATTVPGVAAAAASDNQPKNPYGPRPGGGISLPEYYRPWAALKNRNFYAPGTETLPKNEMRISFLGSTPWPPLPSSTRMQVPDCDFVGGQGVLPRNEIRISVSNHHAVLVVADSVLLLPIKFGDLDFVAVTDGAGVEVLLMPTIHRSHMLDHRLDPQLGRSSRGPVHPQGGKAARKGPEGVHVG